MTIYLDPAINDGRLQQAQLKMLNMLKFVDGVCQKHGLDYWLEGGTLLGTIRHQGFIPWDDDLDIAMPRNSFNQFLQIAPQELPNNMWLQTAKTDTGYFNLSVQLKIRDLNSRYIEKHERGDEPYHQGIFIDIFAYDNIPDSVIRRNLYKFIAKKFFRLLHYKYSAGYLYYGHHGKTYERVARFLPKILLEKSIELIINKANTNKSSYLGYGYDCTNGTYFSHNDIYPLKRAMFSGNKFNIPNRADVILTHQFGNYWQMPPESQRTMKHCRELIPHLIHETPQ